MKSSSERRWSLLDYTSVVISDQTREVEEAEDGARAHEAAALFQECGTGEEPCYKLYRIAGKFGKH